MKTKVNLVEISLTCIVTEKTLEELRNTLKNYEFELKKEISQQTAQKIIELIDYIKSCGTFTNRHWDIVLKQEINKKFLGDKR